MRESAAPQLTGLDAQRSTSRQHGGYQRSARYVSRFEIPSSSIHVGVQGNP